MRQLGPYPLQLPRVGDPRLTQSAVLLTVQVLGQTVLGFNVSVPQIAVAVLSCGLLGALITFARRRVIAWPASALLTGNGVALLLRDPGTSAADTWSTRALGLFAAVAAGSLLSKHLLRVAGRHVFNPSNLGLVVALLLLGVQRADVQVLYWGPWRPGLAAAVAVIVLGAVAVGLRAGVWVVGAVYLASLAAWLGLLSASGHCIVADWSAGPLCGGAFWWRVAASPETLVFAGFMITDPRTVPDGLVGRLWFAAGAGGLGAVLAAPQHDEFGTKLALLGGLTAVSALSGLVRWAAPRLEGRSAPPWARWPAGSVGTSAAALAVAAIGLSFAVPAAGAGARTVVLAGGGRPPTATATAAELVPWPPGLDAPTVSVAAEVADWAPWFRPLDAEARARAVVAELEADRRAAGRPPEVYVAVEALMVRVPATVQDAPEVGLAVTRLGSDGTARTEWYRTESDGASVRIAGPAEPWTEPPG
ncbi:MAG: hypothetical protein R2755_11900 [Acidimicrobiales bacterium]